jgi:hypothetical protein
MGQDGRGFPAMNHGGGPQSPAGGAVLFVIPGEERLAERAAVLDAAEAIREVGAVLHGAERAFRVWVVVGNIRSAGGPGDAPVSPPEGDRLGSHDPAAIGVDVELAGGTWCLRMVSSMNCLARSALSR